jgi:hypothetical protein
VKYKVIVDTSPADAPQEHEMAAALIVAAHFKTDITFLRPGKYRTPDLDVNGEKWELKSPIGDGKKTMENNLRSAKQQSKNIIIDLGRCKMHQLKAISRINYFLSRQSAIKKVKLITKSQKVLDILQ